MLRDKSLIPLSRQHQHALALCVRIDRAAPISESDVVAWQTEIAQHFRAEIRIHFVAEEQFVFPAAKKFPELNSLIEELVNDHSWLRRQFDGAEVQSLSSGEIAQFGRRLAEHVRKEERQLFERLQELMSQDQLAQMGTQLDQALKEAEQACTLAAKPAGKSGLG
jgi:hemerythrin-like domain-containing protein